MVLKTNIYSVNVEKGKNGNVYKQFVITLLIATTMMNYGLQCGWTSPIKKVLQSDYSPLGNPLTDGQMSWVASAIPIAAVFGTSLYAYLADAYGRKISVIAMIVPQLLCWVIKLCTTNFIALIVARILAGLPSGGCFNLIPMYINEISQDNIRGFMVSLGMASINVGYLVIYAIGGYLNYFLILWIMVGVTAIAAVLFIVIVPESPAYLVKIGKFDDAIKTVANLRGLNSGDIVVQNQLEYMKNQEEKFKTVKNITFVSIFKNKAWLRGFIFCMVNVTALDLNGTLSINTYALTVLTEAGVTSSPELQTLSFPVILILGSLVSMFCVDRFGRKRILVGSLLLSALSLVCLASTLLLQQRYDVAVPSWVPVLTIIIAVCSFGGGVQPMVYVILSEMFTFQVRAKLIGVVVTYAWFVAAVQVYCYLPITNNFGMDIMFYIFAGVNLFGGVFALIFVPETMGKTVEEIEQLLLKRRL